MAFATDIRQIAFLRRFSGNMEAPIYKFPTFETATDFVFGNGVSYRIGTSIGKVERLDGAAATTGRPGDGIPFTVGANASALVGFVVSPSIESFISPTAAGANATQTYTTPAAVTASDPIPEDEMLMVMLALPDVVFRMSAGGDDASNAAQDNTDALRTNCILSPSDLTVEEVTPFPVYLNVDQVNATGVCTGTALDFTYPQLPSARGTAGRPDLHEINAASPGTTNPEVEVVITNTAWGATGA